MQQSVCKTWRRLWSSRRGWGMWKAYKLKPTCTKAELEVEGKNADLLQCKKRQKPKERTEYCDDTQALSLSLSPNSGLDVDVMRGCHDTQAHT